MAPFITAIGRAGIDQPDNRYLRAAKDLQTPLIYFRGVGEGQYAVIAPVFLVEDHPAEGFVRLVTGLPFQDVQGQGIVSSEGARREQFAMVARRLDQVRFIATWYRAYRNRCAVCSLRERDLVKTTHIIGWREPGAVEAVVNGLALCAIHHRAYDRNLLGIDPAGVVHIGARLLRGTDGPMLTAGLQGFHGAGPWNQRMGKSAPTRKGSRSGMRGSSRPRRSGGRDFVGRAQALRPKPVWPIALPTERSE